MTTVDQKELKLLPHQFELIKDQSSRVLGLCSGYGGGKTFAAARKAITMMLANPGADGIITEPNYPLLIQILIPEMITALDFFAIPYRYSKADQIFYCDVGGIQTRIICKSMETVDRLIGINAAWVIMDEFDTAKAELAYAAFMRLLGRLRDGNVRQMVIVSTPEGFKAMHRIFITEDSLDKRLIKAKTTDNKYLPQDYIDLLRSSYPEQLISAYLNGEFVNLTSGTVYNAYSRQKHRSTETIQPSEPLFIGMDFNVTKMAATVYVIRNNKEWHAVDEIVDGYDTPAVIEIIEDRYHGHKITVYPDASGKKRASSNGAAPSDIAQLEGAGFAVRAHNSNPRVKDRVNAVNAAFDKGLLYINDLKCPTAADNLEQQIYGKNGEPDKTEGKDHQNDATGYPIAYEMPIIKPVANLNIKMAY